MELNKIYNKDCLNGIKDLPNNSVDLIITDPPYGDNINYGRNGKSILNNKDESINYKILPELFRVLKDNSCCYIFTNWKFECKLRNFINKNTDFSIRMLLVIVKNNMGMGYGFRNQYELCLVLEKGICKYKLNNFSNFQKMRHINHDNSTHPHQKDELLIQKMIQHSSNKNDIVLDPFMGSGTTAVAAKHLCRYFIGFELDKNYYNITIERLKQDNINKWF